MYGVKLIVSDAHAGLTPAHHATVPGVRWQQRKFRARPKDMAHGPRVAMRAEIADASAMPTTRTIVLRLIGDSRTSAAATTRPRALTNWLKANIADALPVFTFPAARRMMLRTNNRVERLNKEITRRTRIAPLVCYEESLLRFLTAVFGGISDAREPQRAYLNRKAV